jgi:hypothetical protein
LFAAKPAGLGYDSLPPHGWSLGAEVKDQIIITNKSGGKYLLYGYRGASANEYGRLSTAALQGHAKILGHLTCGLRISRPGRARFVVL